MVKSYFFLKKNHGIWGVFSSPPGENLTGRYNPKTSHKNPSGNQSPGEEIQEEPWDLESSLMTIAQDFENIIAEDYGGDGSGEIIVGLSKVDKRVKGIQLNQKFGTA